MASFQNKGKKSLSNYKGFFYSCTKNGFALKSVGLTPCSLEMMSGVWNSHLASVPLQGVQDTQETPSTASPLKATYCTYETTSYSHTQHSPRKNTHTSIEGKGREIQRKIQSSVPLSVWTAKSSDFVLSFETRKKTKNKTTLCFAAHLSPSLFNATLERLRRAALTLSPL